MDVERACMEGVGNCSSYGLVLFFNEQNHVMHMQLLE